MTTVAHTNHTRPTTGKFLHRSLWVVQIAPGRSSKARIAARPTDKSFTL